jgi:predicted metal-dependent peptidase
VPWNYAADYAINPSIIESKLELPPDALIDVAYYGQSAEEIYDKIPKDNQSTSCGIGEVMAPGSGEAITGVEANTESDWRVATVRAAQAAKMHGKLPASLERLIDGIVNPKVDWRTTLQHLVQQALAKDDYSWKMPNSRYVASGLYLPSLQSERIPPMVIAVDTSGSIGSTELAEFSAEINAIAAQCKPESIVVIYCDARVNRIEEYEPGDYIELKPVGGGGTNFKPAFTYVEDQALEPCVLIYLTDMHGSFPECAPEYPVIWASTTDQGAPFGSVVNIR